MTRFNYPVSGAMLVGLFCCSRFSTCLNQMSNLSFFTTLYSNLVIAVKQL